MKSHHKIIALSVIASLFFWMLDACIDYFFHYDEPFLTLLLFHKKEVAFRLFFSLCFIAFGFIMARAFARQKNTEAALKMEIAANAQVKESLHVSNQQQQLAILNNIPDLACLKDKEGRYISVNEPFGKTCGLKPGDLIGKTLLKFDPTAKAIVSSGYSDAPVMARYRDFGFRDIISKPYQIEDLSEVLHRVLGAA